MPNYVVLRQISTGVCSDYFETTYVDVIAESPELAIEYVSKVDHK